MIKIQVTEDAIQWLKSDQIVDDQRAEEIIQMIFNLCKIEEDGKSLETREPRPVGYRIRRAALDLISHRRAVGGIRGDLEELARIHELERAIEEEERSSQVSTGKLWPDLSIGDLEKIIDDSAKLIGDYGIIGFTPQGLPKAIEALALLKKREGEGSEDRLYKTARALQDYCDLMGEEAFRSRFGSLDILEPCRKIVEEGEGNPHPWE
jgi:hypothetical protein